MPALCSPLGTVLPLSYWELRPAATGHAPPLGRLAELYECRVADLLADVADVHELARMATTWAHGRTGAGNGDLSGIWRSRYVYPSTGRGKSFTGGHYVVVRHHDHRLIAGRRTSGRWFGFGRDFTINSSEWRPTWCEKA
ncbi:hypothetical protein [Amycolatopsis jejuensis]|uniref:hypothetical protein n=1 Tax=Amycolatopsis jejuensis TaxID=330084 RepID=UPI000B24F271|nr:hypothetical protein [Amycolatopsis jejuensis]